MKKTIISIMVTTLLFCVPAAVGAAMGMGFFKSFLLSVIAVAFMGFIYIWIKKVNEKLNGK